MNIEQIPTQVRRAISHVAGNCIVDRIDEEMVSRLTNASGALCPTWYWYAVSWLSQRELDLETTIGANIYYYTPMPLRHIFDEMTEAYPGLLAVGHGYIPFANETTGSGDPFFVRFGDLDVGVPGVYIIYHDTCDINGVFNDKAVVNLCVSMSELLERSSLTD
jgi:hypothetical protein